MGEPSLPMPAPLDSKRLRIQHNANAGPVGWLETPPRGLQSHGTDHMLTARWTLAQGWADPQVMPYSDLSIPPTASCIHYATQCFEGMKVYRGHDGGLRLFRPNMNCERLRSSASRVSLPGFDTTELERLIIALLAIDGPRWLPAATCRGRSMYIRPAMIADGPTIGVRLPEEALLFVIVVPWPEIDEAFVKNGLRLIASNPTSIRAWPGGFGSTKVGANYGPSFLDLGEARSRGFDQVLWLFGEDGVVTEAGASNFFMVWKTPEGVTQLVTAGLTDKLILPGITRDSVLQLARTRLDESNAATYGCETVEVVERSFNVADVRTAKDEGRLVECFVSGTAYFITPVSLIQYKGEDLDVPMPGGGRNSYAQMFRTWLLEIMYGAIEHPWGVVVPEVELNR